MRLVSFLAPFVAMARRLAVGGLLMAGGVLLAGGALHAAAAGPNGSPVEAPSGAAPQVSAPGSATARIGVLDALMVQLATAPDAASAAPLRRAIMMVWGASGSATAELLEARAVRAASARDTALALDLLDAAIVVAPQWTGGRYERAALHLLRDETGPAIADLQGVLAAEPRHFPSLTMLSVVMEQLGRKAEALVLLRRAVALDPHAEGQAERLARLTIEVEGREL